MRKVRFHLKGGLGNQLFILAAALHAAHIGGARRIILDTSFLRHDSKRSLELGNFELPSRISLSQGLLHSLIHKDRFFKIRKYSGKIIGHEQKTSLAPPFSNFLCFEGYFQEIQFADAVREDMLKILESAYLEPTSVVLPENYFAAHLRRGDYLNPETLAVHGLVSAEYIKKGILHLQTSLEPMPVIVFTDSPKVAKEELGDWASKVVIIGPDQVSAQGVVLLMSRARGLVISNSSLSWWAAWLATRKPNTTSPKIVRPEYWYSQEETSEGLVPEDWVVIEN